VSKFNKFGDLVARVAIAVFVGGGLYGFFGPNRQMGCDGVIGVKKHFFGGVKEAEEALQNKETS
jgi:hypothetical protein